MTGDLFGQATDTRCLACGHHHPDARERRLHDGTTAGSYSEAWRVEAEALSILEMFPISRRGSYLRDIEKRRGKKAADELKRIVTAIWNQRQATTEAA